MTAAVVTRDTIRAKLLEYNHEAKRKPCIVGTREYPTAWDVAHDVLNDLLDDLEHAPA